MHQVDGLLGCSAHKFVLDHRMPEQHMGCLIAEGRQHGMFKNAEHVA